MERPVCLSDEMLQSLQAMEQETDDNIFSLVPQLLQLNPNLTPYEAQQILLYWQHRVPTTSE